MKLKIKSRTDVITNSSSEVYLIKNSGSADYIRSVWQEYLEKHAEEWNLGDPEFPDYCGVWDYYAEDKPDGVVEFGYDILCNLDDCYGGLCELFGKENVEDYEWR